MAERAWTALELDVLNEHIEDFRDGIITRRELLRRVTFMTGSLVVTMALLPTLGCNVDRPRAGAPATAAAAAPSATALATAQATAFAVPPAAATTDGITVRPDDPRITVVATAGFAAITVDLLAREGGAERIDPAQYPTKLTARTPEALVADLRAALVHLRGLPFVNRDRLGAVGFGFGGGMMWHLFPSNYIAVLSAAVPFYGPPPMEVSVLAGSKGSAFAVYAEQDIAITGTRAHVEEQLKKGGLPYQITVYPGVDHGFHNDTGARYNADQAQRAWISTIEWLRKYLV